MKHKVPIQLNIIHCCNCLPPPLQLFGFIGQLWTFNMLQQIFQGSSLENIWWFVMKDFDDIWATMTVWRTRVKIIRTVLCCIV